MKSSKLIGICALAFFAASSAFAATSTGTVSLTVTVPESFTIGTISDVSTTTASSDTTFQMPYTCVSGTTISGLSYTGTNDNVGAHNLLTSGGGHGTEYIIKDNINMVDLGSVTDFSYFNCNGSQNNYALTLHLNTPVATYPGSYTDTATITVTY